MEMINMKIIENLMNKKITHSLLFSLFAGLAPAFSAIAAEAPKNPYAYENFKQRFSKEELMANHSVSPELKAALDAEYPNGNPPVNTSCLNDYFIKQERGRVIGSLLIRECAQAHNLNLVSAPIKKLYTSKKGKLRTIAQKINPSGSLFSLLQIMQLYKISKLTGFRDIQEFNIFNTQEGIAYVIDTEEGFSFIKDYLTHDKNFVAIFKRRTLKNCLQLRITPEAKEWVKKKIAKYETRTEEEIFYA